MLVLSLARAKTGIQGGGPEFRPPPRNKSGRAVADSMGGDPYLRLGFHASRFGRDLLVDLIAGRRELAVDRRTGFRSCDVALNGALETAARHREILGRAIGVVLAT